MQRHGIAKPKLSLLSVPPPRPLPAEREEILVTKLGPSFVLGPLLQRTRLFAKLNSNPKASLVLIHGMAGSGKSNLLHSYFEAQESPAAWYSLEESDQDRKIFLRYFFRAIALHHPDLAHPLVERLEAPVSVEEEWKNLLVLFINALCNYKKRVWVALDDYHLLQNRPQIAEMMELFAKHAPSNFRCFVATRELPQLPLAYLKSKNALVLITPSDLQLNLPELRELFEDIFNIPLPQSSLELIQARTEGWFAAVRLLAQAIQDKSSEDALHYLRGLNLKENFIFDYLAHEIYAKQHEGLQKFLKYTSILSSFNPDLAEFITTLPNAKELLQNLEQMSLFVVHLDERQEWIRYHHLFSEYLRNCLLNEEGSEYVMTLHRRAGQWYETRQMTSDAIEHFLRGGDHQSASRLLKKAGQSLFHQGALTSLSRWLEQIPPQNMDGNSDLLLLKGQVYDATGSWERAVSHYEQAYAVLKTEGRKDKIPAVLEKLILCLIKYGEYSKIFGYCNEALKVCEPENLSLRSKLLGWFGVARVIYGGDNWEAAYERLRESYTLAYQSGDPEAISSACIGYGFTYHFPQGNFPEAERVFNEGARLLERIGLQFLACHPTMNKAVSQVFGGQFEAAEETIAELERTLERYDAQFVKQALYVTKLLLLLARKRLEEAQKVASVVSEQEVPLQIKPWYYRCLVLIYLSKNNMEQAMVAAKEMMAQLQIVGVGMYAPECYITMGFLHQKKNLTHQARQWYEKSLAIAEKGKMKFWMMKAHYCLAALFMKHKFEFKHHFISAIHLARENDYFSFWTNDLYGFTFPLLRNAIRLRIERDSTRKIGGMMKDRILTEAEALLRKEKGSVRYGGCSLLQLLDDERAYVLLKQAENDARKTVREKAHKASITLQLQIPQLTICTLGPFSIAKEGKPIPFQIWKRPKALKIFKYLLSVYPKEVKAEELIDTFWPNAPLKEARHNLHVHINLIRKALNPTGPKRDETFIGTRGESFVLSLRRGDFLDLVDFQSFLQNGTELWEKREHEQAERAFSNAVKLYRGDFLEEDLYEEWAARRRSELQTKYLSAVERLAACREKRGELRDSAMLYALYLERQPTNERILRILIRHLNAIGDLASARKAYDRFKAALWEQFSELPSSRLQNFTRRLFVTR